MKSCLNNWFYKNGFQLDGCRVYGSFPQTGVWLLVFLGFHCEISATYQLSNDWINLASTLPDILNCYNSQITTSITFWVASNTMWKTSHHSLWRCYYFWAWGWVMPKNFESETWQCLKACWEFFCKHPMVWVMNNWQGHQSVFVSRYTIWGRIVLYNMYSK